MRQSFREVRVMYPKPKYRCDEPHVSLLLEKPEETYVDVRRDILSEWVVFSCRSFGLSCLYPF